MLLAFGSDKVVAPVPVAAGFLLLSVAVLWLVLGLLSRYASKPGVLWGVGGYLTGLHVIAIAGLLNGSLLGEAFSHLTLFTFPFSMSVADGEYIPGFGTLAGLWSNYVRYIVLFGTMNSLMLAGFLTLILPGRRRASPGPILPEPEWRL